MIRHWILYLSAIILISPGCRGGKTEAVEDVPDDFAEAAVEQIQEIAIEIEEEDFFFEKMDETGSGDDGGGEDYSANEDITEDEREDFQEISDQFDSGDPAYYAWLGEVSCKTTPPDGAVLAAPFPAYGMGACPEISPGMNGIDSKGNKRQFMVVAPSDLKPEENLPVLFMWYWLKADAGDFFEKGEVQKAVDLQRFVAVIPESKWDLDLFGLVDIPWPFMSFTPKSRFEEEHAFFDDMLACVSQKYNIDKECVSAVGVSAGALYVVLLAGARSGHLSSFMSLSGGTKDDGIVTSIISPFIVPSHKLPALVLWGGPYDSCVMLNFQDASIALEDKLIAGGHFFVECIHNCKHGEPPVVAPEGQSKYAAIWDFAFPHPFWLKPGESPFTVTGLPESTPEWCAIGKGNAIPRVGECPEPGCPL